eukprot:3027368-Amphidinium_carterae.2
MRAVLPAFHTVRVTLLDAVESPANKCSSFLQLQTSLRQWTRSIRISMSRYVEAEVDAILQDQGVVSTGSNKPNARGNAATASQTGGVSDSSRKAHSSTHDANAAGIAQDTKPSESKLDLCRSWGTNDGCRFGKGCKYRHPNAKISDGLCFICGAKTHRSTECKLRTAGGDKPSSGGSGGNQQRGTPAAGKGGNKASNGKGDKARSSSRGKAGEAGGSGQRPSSQGERARGSSAQAEGKDSARQRSTSRDRGRSGSGNKRQGKPGGNGDGKKVANPARALSAAVDDTTSAEGLLDSGASHVIAPLEELGDHERQGSQRVSLTLASGKPTESVIKEGEVYAHRVRRVLIPLGKLIRQTGVLTVWAKSGLHLLAADETGRLRLVYKPVLRQGGMPHVCTSAVSGFRSALKDTRKEPVTLTFEQWEGYLGCHIPVSDVRYCVTEDDVAVHGKPSQETSCEVEGLGCSVRDVASILEPANNVLDKLARNAERLSESLVSCLGTIESCINDRDSPHTTACSMRDSTQTEREWNCFLVGCSCCWKEERR